MPEALILYGSVARGTETQNSDVDLLAVGGESSAFSVKSNGVEIQNFSLDKFMNLASSGDLFAAHIAMEGKVIFDPKHIFPKFRESFRLKESYQSEIDSAFDLASFILYYGAKYQDQELIARRMAWSLRTVLIAKLAEEGRFVFSPEGLCREFTYDWVHELLDLRRGGARLKYKKAATKFLSHFDALRMPLPYSGYVRKFIADNNSVALGTLEQLRRKHTYQAYPIEGSPES